eukprot:TRINITY_DN3640_c0_g1_i1.p1 TRINITY_DN3640_c0_g1~~TRINITY_DN3640_c0_g1_i1.p1  ORF type:complete len:694 (-),score=217.59 TRINITY_DN3640_c0_g1_i1:1751-3832(-)
MIRRPPRSTLSSSSAASDVYKRQYQRRVRGTMAVLHALLLASAAALVAGTTTYNTDYTVHRRLAHLVIGSWIVLAAAVVFFMQAGFGMLEAGLVQGKNTKHILIKNLLDSALGALTWWSVGYAMSAGGNDAASGSTHFFLAEDFDSYVHFAFTYAFACTAATVVSGAMAERTRFGSYLVYTVVITGVVHPVVVYWINSNEGWMSVYRTAYGLDTWWGNGFIDYSGGVTVHVVGGFAALCGSFFLGPRNNRFVRGLDGRFDAKWAGHNITYTTLGTFVLWFCWYPFNAGSVYLNLQKSDCEFTGLCAAASSCAGAACSDSFLELQLPLANNIAGKVCAVSTLCAASSAVLSMWLSKLYLGYFDLRSTLNGLIAGLVAISSGCGVLEPWPAVLIGLLAALVYTQCSRGMVALGLDDPLEAFPVHGACGALGSLSVGLFMSENGFQEGYFRTEVDGYGLVYGGGGKQLGIQAVGLVVVVVWTVAIASCTFVCLIHAPKVLPFFYREADGAVADSGLRISYIDEEAGSDYLKHGGSAYPEFEKRRREMEFFSVEVDGVPSIAELHMADGKVKLFNRLNTHVFQWERFSDMASCSLAIHSKLLMSIQFQSAAPCSIKFRSAQDRQRFYDYAMYTHFNGQAQQPGYRLAGARVWVGTWNMGNSPSPDNLELWFAAQGQQGHQFDIVCIGVQEARCALLL